MGVGHLAARLFLDVGALWLAMKANEFPGGSRGDVYWEWASTPGWVPQSRLPAATSSGRRDFLESFLPPAGFSVRKDMIMRKNVGSLDRVMRSLGGVAMLLGAFLAPLQLGVRVGLGATGVYMVLTALAGTCLGYRMMGMSTCPMEHR